MRWAVVSRLPWVIATRSVTFLAPRVAVRRTALRGARTVTLRVAITHGGRLTTAQRTLRVPTPR